MSRRKLTTSLSWDNRSVHAFLWRRGRRQAQLLASQFTFCSWCYLAQVWIQRFWDPGRFPVWSSCLTPCVVTMPFLLTMIHMLEASLIQIEMFQSRTPRNSQHILFAVTYLDVCLFDKPQSQAPMWIFLNEQVSKCTLETAVFRRRLQFQLNQTSFTFIKDRNQNLFRKHR